jgi:hypothetical protein
LKEIATHLITGYKLGCRTIDWRFDDPLIDG